RCILTTRDHGFEGIALSEQSIWGNRGGDWEVFRNSGSGTFVYAGTKRIENTACLESSQSSEHLASGRCTWQRGLKGPEPRMPHNSALLTDAFSSLRYACGAAKRERYASTERSSHQVRTPRPRFRWSMKRFRGLIGHEDSIAFVLCNCHSRSSPASRRRGRGRQSALRRSHQRTTRRPCGNI